MRRLLLAMALLLPHAARGADDWAATYRRADVVQAIGLTTFSVAGLSATAGLAFLVPNHWGKGTRVTNGVGRALLTAGIAGFAIGPGVMLGGALSGRSALKDAPLFTLQGPNGTFGSGRGGQLGVVAYVVAVGMVPLAAATRDQLVWAAGIPLALSWFAASQLIANNRVAWDKLRPGAVGEPNAIRIPIGAIELPF